MGLGLSSRDGGMTSVAVVIVNHNTRNHLKACLASVRAERPTEIVVVDNASEDGSGPMVRAEFPEVTLYTNATNPGFGAAANQAIARISLPYVLLLNSDTRLQTGVLMKLSTYLDQHSRAAIVGPRLLYPNGSLQPSCFPFPTPLHIFLEESNLGPLIRYIPVLRDHYLRTWPHTYDRVVPWLMGGAIALRREAYEAVGGFDPSFFLYCEEVDLCYRLQQAGWQVHFTTAATIEHVGGASTSRKRAEMHHQFYASKLRYSRLHLTRPRQLASVVIIKSAMLAKLIRDNVRLRLRPAVQRRALLLEDIAIWRRVLLES
jgi:GT2 family glycosyltransferase